MANPAFAFGTIAVGGLALAAGITGSTVHSVVQGKPDGVNKKQKPPSSGTVEKTSSITAPKIGRGKYKQLLGLAYKEIGTPYRWGGSEPGGFDCSGLVQYVFSKYGVRLPRTAQEQYDATRRIKKGEQLIPGNLVFFGTGSSDITHVGIYVGENKMIDAPHTGADVRVEHIPLEIGAAWGEDKLIGFGEA